MLTPKEQTIFKNRLMFFIRRNPDSALEDTIKWFDWWYEKLVGAPPPKDYREEVITFLKKIKEKKSSSYI